MVPHGRAWYWALLRVMGQVRQPPVVLWQRACALAATVIDTGTIPPSPPKNRLTFSSASTDSDCPDATGVAQVAPFFVTA